MAKKINSRTIHYIWLGGKEKPSIIQNCLNSWKKHMPDWTIIEWNETNFPFEDYPFANEALKRKRYAFASDVIRLWALYYHGGLFMDADVLVVKPLDRFLEHKAFTGCETNDLWVTATMGSVKGHSWIKMLLDYYKDREYSENTNTNIITQLSKPLLVSENKHGYKMLKDDVVIYPVSHFCSFNHQKLEIIPHPDAYAYHLFCGSWTTRGEKLWIK